MEAAETLGAPRESLRGNAVAPWKAALSLGFSARNGKTVLSEKRFDGPLVVQKPLYPEGESVCHAIVVHPPGGIAGGDELEIDVDAPAGAHALLTTPGAGKWYRSSGARARQSLRFKVGGVVEWLPRETIVFDGARAELDWSIRLEDEATFIGWDVVCLGRTGSGERFASGMLELHTRLMRGGKLAYFERGRVAGGGHAASSAAGLGGRSVFGTMLCASPRASAAEVSAVRQVLPACAVATLLPGLVVCRYLGDSTEEAMGAFGAAWGTLRPLLAEKAAIAPRIWST